MQPIVPPALPAAAPIAVTRIAIGELITRHHQARLGENVWFAARLKVGCGIERDAAGPASAQLPSLTVRTTLAVGRAFAVPPLISCDIMASYSGSVSIDDLAVSCTIL